MGENTAQPGHRGRADAAFLRWTLVRAMRKERKEQPCEIIPKKDISLILPCQIQLLDYFKSVFIVEGPGNGYHCC